MGEGIDDRHVGAGQQRQVMRCCDMRRAYQPDFARIDDNQLRTFAQSPFHLRGEHRVCHRRVGTDDHDDVGIHDAIEWLRARRRAERRIETVPGGRMTDARAGVHVVVAKRGAHEFLYDEHFFVGATRRCNAADGFAAVLSLNFLEALRSKANRLIPAHFTPRVTRIFTNQRFHDAIAMRGVAPGKAAFDTAVAVIGLAVFVRRHAHDLFAFHLDLE